MLTMVYLVNMVGGGSVSRGIVWAVATLRVSLVFPQLMFKPGVRSLTINEAGISTTIGSQSAQVLWANIRRIEDVGDRMFVLGKNLNSFVIPSRAFGSASERKEFFEKASAWLVGTTPPRAG